MQRTVFEYGRGRIMLAMSGGTPAAETARRLLLAVPERMRPDVNELVALGPGEQIELADGRYVERVR